VIYKNLDRLEILGRLHWKNAYIFVILGVRKISLGRKNYILDKYMLFMKNGLDCTLSFLTRGLWLRNG